MSKFKFWRAMSLITLLELLHRLEMKLDRMAMQYVDYDAMKIEANRRGWWS